MQEFCAGHKRDTTHFSRKKKDVWGGRENPNSNCGTQRNV